MAIGFESLRLRHMPLDWVGHLVRAGSRIVSGLSKPMVPISIRKNCAWIESLLQSYGDRWDCGLQLVPIGHDGFEVLSDGLASSQSNLIGLNCSRVVDFPQLSHNPVDCKK